MILKAAFIAYIVVRVKLNPSLAPTTQLAAYQGWEKLKPLVKYVIPILSIFLVVVASMSFGFGTPTESAAVGALATVVLALAYRALTRENLLGHDLVHHRRGDNILADFVVFWGEQWNRVANRRARPDEKRDHR